MSLRPACGEPPSEKTMWVSGNLCYLESCCREECCFDVEPGITDVKDCSLVTLNADWQIVQLTPATLPLAMECKEIWFSPKAICPIDYCKERMVEKNITLDCECINWCDDATPEFMEEALMWAKRFSKIKCESNC